MQLQNFWKFYISIPVFPLTRSSERQMQPTPSTEEHYLLLTDMHSIFYFKQVKRYSTKLLLNMLSGNILKIAFFKLEKKDLNTENYVKEIKCLKLLNWCCVPLNMHTHIFLHKLTANLRNLSIARTISVTLPISKVMTITLQDIVIIWHTFN